MTKTLLFAAAIACGTIAHAQSITTIPTDLTTETWEVEAQSLASDNATWNQLNYTCQVGFADDKVYIQGLADRFPEAWIEGTISDGALTISAGQELGVFKSSTGSLYDIYFSGYDGQTTAIVDAEWEYDSANRSIYGDYFVTTAQLTSIYALDAIAEINIIGPQQDGIGTVIAPTSVATAYNFAGQPLHHSASGAEKGIVITNGRKTIK